MTLKTFVHIQKFKKGKKYGRIAKIVTDSVSASPIYTKQLKNPKSDTKNFSVKTRNV